MKNPLAIIWCLLAAAVLVLFIMDSASWYTLANIVLAWFGGIVSALLLGQHWQRKENCERANVG